MTILHELALPEKLRETGAEVLLYHDIREDTTAQFPKSISKRIIRFVEMMTFASFDEEVTLLWEQPPEIRLFKLYDKVSNWMDGAWMYPERRIIHREHLRKIADDVEQNFGLLNIVHIARALTKTP